MSYDVKIKKHSFYKEGYRPLSTTISDFAQLLKSHHHNTLFSEKTEYGQLLGSIDEAFARKKSAIKEGDYCIPFKCAGMKEALKIPVGAIKIDPDFKKYTHRNPVSIVWIHESEEPRLAKYLKDAAGIESDAEIAEKLGRNLQSGDLLSMDEKGARTLSRILKKSAREINTPQIEADERSVIITEATQHAEEEIIKRNSGKASMPIQPPPPCRARLSNC